VAHLRRPSDAEGRVDPPVGGGAWRVLHHEGHGLLAGETAGDTLRNSERRARRHRAGSTTRLPRGTSPGSRRRSKEVPTSREHSRQARATARGRKLVVSRPARACWVNHLSGALRSDSENPDVRRYHSPKALAGVRTICELFSN
jgi:hypothetical protein